MELLFSAKDISVSLGITKRGVLIKAKNENWQSEIVSTQGGKSFLYYFKKLDTSTQTAILKSFPEKFDTNKEYQKSTYSDYAYNSEALWEHYRSKSEAARQRAEEKHKLLIQIETLVDAGIKRCAAFNMVGKANDTSPKVIQNWYYGKGAKRGVRDYHKKDWLAVLVDEYTNAKPRQEENCHPMAWDWFLAHYLDRSRPTLADSYRRLQETAAVHGWTIPCARTLKRRLESEIPPIQIAYLREGEKAMRRFYPAQERDKNCFMAGEAVNGDGLKFDKFWVEFEDGEVINTATAWIWQDVHSGKLLAWRLGKTENTDIFRLSLYDLTETMVPSFAWMDNTRVAANKAMTGKSPRRRRFKNQPSDPVGMMQKLGIEPRFTNPDQKVSNPGVKPVERAFGIGGIHDAVRAHPRFADRGFSKATAIPVGELRAVLEDEVVRFNARTGRRSGICQGRSYDEVFAESFVRYPVRKITNTQRSLLLLMQEVVRVHRDDGGIALDAGKGPYGRNRYWNERLPQYEGRDVVVYFDPENLQNDVQVYTLDGNFICEAQWLPGAAFNDVEAAREWNKNKRRYLKAQKETAKAQQRMDKLEMARLYPSPTVPDQPKAAVIAPTFGGADLPGTAGLESVDEKRVKELQAGMDNLIRQAAEQRRRDQEWELPTGRAALPGA